MDCALHEHSSLHATGHLKAVHYNRRDGHSRYPQTERVALIPSTTRVRFGRQIGAALAPLAGNRLAAGLDVDPGVPRAANGLNGGRSVGERSFLAGADWDCVKIDALSIEANVLTGPPESWPNIAGEKHGQCQKTSEGRR
jgi:hypothetical protein